MKSIAIVDVQGFKIDDNKFILKEIAIVCKDNIQVFLVQPPFPYSQLTPKECKLVSWIERNRKLYWNEGFITYDQVLLFIANYLLDKTIYCKGTEKVTWIRNMLCYNNNEVINLENMNCPNFLTLYEQYRLSKDVYSCIYHPTICALKNVMCLKNWCISKQLINI